MALIDGEGLRHHQIPVFSGMTVRECFYLVADAGYDNPVPEFILCASMGEVPVMISVVADFEDRLIRAIPEIDLDEPFDP